MNDKPVAVITGASRGIGRSVAIALAAEGYDIAAIARSVDSEGMEYLSKEVEKKGAQFFPTGLDISCTSCQKEVVSNILERYGRVDILVKQCRGSSPSARRYSRHDRRELRPGNEYKSERAGIFCPKGCTGNDLAETTDR